VLIALNGGPLVQSLLFPEIAWLQTAVDRRGLLFIAACAVAGGAVAAAVPVWQVARVDLVNRLRSGARIARQRTRGQTLMLTLQGALSVVLLIGAGLFVRSLEEAGTVDLGLDVGRLLVVSASTGDADVRPDFAASLAERIRQVPSVVRVSAVSGTLPFVSSWAVRTNVPGLPERPNMRS
jgi:hypothetical protein